MSNRLGGEQVNTQLAVNVADGQDEDLVGNMLRLTRPSALPKGQL